MKCPAIRGTFAITLICPTFTSIHYGSSTIGCTLHSSTPLRLPPTPTPIQHQFSPNFSPLSSPRSAPPANPPATSSNWRCNKLFIHLTNYAREKRSLSQKIIKQTDNTTQHSAAGWLLSRPFACSFARSVAAHCIIVSIKQLIKKAINVNMGCFVNEI